jgi:4-diphosphocytidyl-2-C-methyl-D-erythritol kinase
MSNEEMQYSHWLAPAKINLFLHVLGRRADGYHELQTVFQMLDWCDEIAIRVRTDGRICRAKGPLGVNAEDDLAVRAAIKLKQLTQCELGADIAVTKHIPMGAGLGGGSSDAATVLLALNSLWGLNWPTKKIASIGLSLGADVPFFIQGHSAWAEGVGERLTPISLPERWYVVLNPDVHVATKDIFSAAELTRSSPPMTIDDFLSGQSTRNDLEPVVCSRYVRVREALSWLGAFASARMTGSGGCIFATMSSEHMARHVASKCPSVWSAYAVKGIAQSSLRLG